MNTVIEIDILEDVAELGGASLRPDYSGRGMYGDECVGFVADNIFKVGVALGDVLGGMTGTAEAMCNAAVTDSMGYSTIVYFPGFVTEYDADPEGEA